jgi:hypothetical protein
MADWNPSDLDPRLRWAATSGTGSARGRDRLGSPLLSADATAAIGLSGTRDQFVPVPGRITSIICPAHFGDRLR